MRKENSSPSFGGATFICADCGRETPRTGSTQKYCHACSDRIRHPRTGTGRGKGARLNRKFLDTAQPKSLAGLPIVEVDRLAKENHTSYGQIVAGWWEERQKAAAGGTATTN